MYLQRKLQLNTVRYMETLTALSSYISSLAEYDPIPAQLLRFV